MIGNRRLTTCNMDSFCISCSINRNQEMYSVRGTSALRTIWTPPAYGSINRETTKKCIQLGETVHYAQSKVNSTVN